VFRCTRCEYSCAFYHYTVHTGLRVQRASGIPHALNGARDASTPRALRAAGAKSYLKLERRHCERSEAIHPFFLYVARWIASLRSQ
jgi:hypothetical protein